MSDSFDDFWDNSCTQLTDFNATQARFIWDAAQRNQADERDLLRADLEAERARVSDLSAIASVARDALYEHGEECSRLDKASAIAVADLVAATLSRTGPEALAEIQAGALERFADRTCDAAMELELREEAARIRAGGEE